MFCYAVFHNNTQIMVYPYDSVGNDWQRARALAIALAERAETNGYHYTVEHFGATGIGKTIWK